MKVWDVNGKPRKPRILCIGAQKAGTSWLHQQLNEHPKIWTTPFKEVHYFDARHIPENRKWLPWHFRNTVRGTERRFAARGQEMPDAMVEYLTRLTAEPMFTPRWYREAFAPAPRGMLPLDTTPEYSTLPEGGVDEVAAFLPNAKFIYLIRDPVERALSQLRMNLARWKKLPKTPQGYMQHLDDPLLDNRGDYATYVPRWQARFGPDRLLILPYGRIASDPAALMREVEAFLGLAPHDYPGLGARIHKGVEAVPVPDEARAALRQRFAGQYDFLAEMFGPEFMADLSPPAPDGAAKPAAPSVAASPAPDIPPDGPPRLPTVIGIGAQKAGTSWLHAMLSQHPGLWASPLKEAHYFDHLYCPENRRWTPGHVSGAVDRIRAHHRAQGQSVPPNLDAYLDRISAVPFTPDWYAGLFAPAPVDTRPIDITPAYSGLPPEGVQAAVTALPEAQFIYILRDPVDRAISQLRMNLSRAGRTPKGLKQWLVEAEAPVLAARGDYATYVPRWQAALGPDRLLILPYGLIGTDPAEMMRRIERFLKLGPHSYRGLEKRVFASSAQNPAPPKLREVLARRFADQYAFLGAHFDEAFNAALR